MLIESVPVDLAKSSEVFRLGFFCFFNYFHNDFLRLDLTFNGLRLSLLRIKLVLCWFHHSMT